MQKDMPHTERHIERNVLDIHFRANDGVQNLEIYARCFQWEQKSCVPQFECVEESSNASRSRTRDREIALGAYRLCSILQGCVAISMAHLVRSIIVFAAPTSAWRMARDASTSMITPNFTSIR